jgi:ABC-type multidrug transport system ATPase subunit
VNKKIKYLSGGEKSRLRLCSLTFEGANLLILDEPTNHLDVDSREVLEETLNDFEGTLLFVSHDRYFINKLADKVITIEEGTLHEYDGDYAYYQEERKKELERKSTLGMKPSIGIPVIKGYNTSTGDKRKPATTANPKGEIRNNSNHSTVQVNRNSERKLEQLETLIEELESKLKELQDVMDIHSTDGAKLQELYTCHKKLENELETAYSEWELLQVD